MPPCFSPASATAETASNDNIAAAHACTLRMLPSSIVRPHPGPIFSNDIMAGSLRNQQARVSILALRTNASIDGPVGQRPAPGWRANDNGRLQHAADKLQPSLSN